MHEALVCGRGQRRQKARATRQQNIFLAVNYYVAWPDRT